MFVAYLLESHLPIVNSASTRWLLSPLGAIFRSSVEFASHHTDISTACRQGYSWAVCFCFCVARDNP
jgi:hypothetical protein